MVSQQITRYVNASNSASSIFLEKFTLTGAQNSIAYLLPIIPIQDIAINNTGSAVIYLTNNSTEDITNDTATWITYDGTSLINQSITAIKAINSASTSTITITIRTFGV